MEFLEFVGGKSGMIFEEPFLQLIDFDFADFAGVEPLGKLEVGFGGEGGLGRWGFFVTQC